MHSLLIEASHSSRSPPFFSLFPSPCLPRTKLNDTAAMIEGYTPAGPCRKFINALFSLLHPPILPSVCAPLLQWVSFWPILNIQRIFWLANIWKVVICFFPLCWMTTCVSLSSDSSSDCTESHSFNLQFNPQGASLFLSSQNHIRHLGWLI